MKKSTLAAWLATPSLVFSAHAAQSAMPQEMARSCAFDAIEATIGAGNISAQKLSGSPLGGVQEAGTSILATKGNKGRANQTVHAFVTEDGSLAAFTTSTTNKKGVPSSSHSTYRAENDYNGTTGFGLFGSSSEMLFDKVVTSFQHCIDNANMANIEVMAHKVMQNTLPENTISYTQYDEQEPTAIHVRSCSAGDKGTVCNELTTKLWTNPKTQAVGMEVAASLILPAAQSGALRETMTVTTTMDDIRDPSTLGTPRTPEIKGDIGLIRAAALASETLMVFENFLATKRGVTQSSPRVGVDFGGIKYNATLDQAMKSNVIELEVDMTPPDFKAYGRPAVKGKTLDAN